MKAAILLLGLKVVIPLARTSLASFLGNQRTV